MKAEQVILKYGGDILAHKLVIKSKDCVQHGDISVYTHCFMQYESAGDRRTAPRLFYVRLAQEKNA